MASEEAPRSPSLAALPDPVIETKSEVSAVSLDDAGYVEMTTDVHVKPVAATRASIIASTLLRVGSEKRHHDHLSKEIHENDIMNHIQAALEICKDVAKVLKLSSYDDDEKLAESEILKFQEAKGKLERARNVNNGASSLPYIDAYCMYIAIFSGEFDLHVLETLLEIGVDAESTVPQLPQSGDFSPESLGLSHLGKTKRKPNRITKLKSDNQFQSRVNNIMHRNSTSAHGTTPTASETSSLEQATPQRISSTGPAKAEKSKEKKWGWLEEVLGRMYSSRPSRAINALCIVLKFLDSIKGFKYLHQATIVKNIEIEPRHLHRLGNALIEGADFPIIMSLELAQLCKELASVYIIEAENFKNLQDSFTETAMNMVHSFKTDHHAAFAITEIDPLFHSALYVALKSRNLKFIGSPRVSRIINTMWSEPHFMKNAQFTSSGKGIKSLGFTLLFQPKDFTMLPYGKFIIEAFGFLLFLFCYSIMTLKTVKVGEPLSPFEIFTWLQALAYVIEEIREMYAIGAIKYLQDESNRVDVLISLGMIIVFSIRTSTATSGVVSSVYSFWEVFNAIMLWFRIGFVFQVHPTIGPLLRTTFSIMNDVVNFVIMTALFVIGFSLSLFFLLNDQGLPEFSSLSQTFLTLYIGHLGDFDYEQFSLLADANGFYGFTYYLTIILFSVYLFTSSVVMLNLLIGMYF
jgi:hypothetical protein